MCGILGIIHKSDYNISDYIFRKINQLNYNRGPDNQGFLKFKLLNNEVKLGHSRLSILDLSKDANQPMHSFSERFVISFNGEIYNHLELRKKINEKKFISWKTTSDTETLLNLFEFWSPEIVLEQIEGMFSFIVFDKMNNKIFAARDMVGEKPLYFCFNKNFIAFASDLKTIVKLPEIKKDISQSSIQKYLEYNYIPSPNTISKNIYKLPAASYLSVELKMFNFTDVKEYNHLNSLIGVKNNKWWNLNYSKNKIKKFNKLYWEEKIQFSLNKAVKDQLISDAPLGAFLSGGIDSSLIVSLMQQNQKNTKTFTIGYENDNFDESNYAKEISNILSTDHTSHIFSNDDIKKTIQESIYAFSEPFSDSSQLPTLLVSKIAREKVKVVLTGDGGDELFGGYNRYIYANRFWKYLKFLNPNFRNIIIDKILNFTPNIFLLFFGNIFNLKLNNDSIFKIKNKLKKIKNEESFYDTLTKEWTSESQILNSNSNIDSFINLKKIFNTKNLSFEEKMMTSDFLTYLPDDILCKVDRSTMNYSLESRAPFLNRYVIKNAFDLPIEYKIKGGNSKIILKNILKKYIPSNIINRPKMGFGIPIADFIRNDLKSWTNDVLSKTQCDNHGFFNYEVVEKEKNQHFNNEQNNQHKLWSLIQFNEWYHKIHLDK